MNAFITDTSSILNGELSPSKHVNFTFGMVLGEKDFNQQFAFHEGRDQWLARDAIGYGTLRGLRVRFEGNATLAPRIVVEPGAALSPRGQMICVTPEQCAVLDKWLEAQAQDDAKKQALAAHIFKGTGAGGAEVDKVRLFVTLCYRSCPTDAVPIPGEPCRSEDLAMAASRWQDDFQLELRYAPPEQFEEDGLRDFVEWLRPIPLLPTSTTTLDQFAAALRRAVHSTATPEVLDFLLAPPAAELTIPTAQARDFYHHAFLLWVTEVRPLHMGLHRFVTVMRRVIGDMAARTTGNIDTPAQFAARIEGAAHLTDAVVTAGYLDENAFKIGRLDAELLNQYRNAALEVWRTKIEPRWMATGGTCAYPPDEGCLLLAEALIELTATLTPSRTVATTDDTEKRPLITLNEKDRPYVMHLRMLQEWMLADVRTLVQEGGDGPLPGTDVVSETTFGLSKIIGTPGAYAPANHSHGTPSDPIPNHIEDLDGHANHEIKGDVTGTLGLTKVEQIQAVPVLPQAPGAGQVLTYNGTAWQPATPTTGGPIPTAAGDVTGDIGDNTVVAIQSVPVLGDQPSAAGQVLTYNGTAWAPATPAASTPIPTAAGDVTGDIGDNTVVAIQSVPVLGDQPTATGQVLTYNGTAWAPAPPIASTPIPTAAGDVTGAIADNTVVAIQSVPVDPQAPGAGQVMAFNGTAWKPSPVETIQTVPVLPQTPGQGQVLTYRNDSWRPETPTPTTGDGPFVGRPPDSLQYEIVAAGVVGEAPTLPVSPNAPILGDLTVEASGEGEIIVNFRNYRKPGRQHQYIVKVLPVFPFGLEDLLESIAAPTVYFSEFLEDNLGVKLRVKDGVDDIDSDRLAKMEFMIEVSRYIVNRG